MSGEMRTRGRREREREWMSKGRRETEGELGIKMC